MQQKLGNRTEVYVKQVEDMKSIEDLIVPKVEQFFNNGRYKLARSCYEFIES